MQSILQYAPYLFVRSLIAKYDRQQAARWTDQPKEVASRVECSAFKGTIWQPIEAYGLSSNDDEERDPLEIG